MKVKQEFAEKLVGDGFEKKTAAAGTSYAKTINGVHSRYIFGKDTVKRQVLKEEGGGGRWKTLWKRKWKSVILIKRDGKFLIAEKEGSEK